MLLLGEFYATVNGPAVISVIFKTVKLFSWVYINDQFWIYGRIEVKMAQVLNQRMLNAIVGGGDGDTFDMLFKVVVIGDCGVGKTCVVQRFKAGTYVERHGNTIGVDFSMKTVVVDGKKVKVSCLKFLLMLPWCYNYLVISLTS